MTAKQIRLGATAHHEAGHAIAAWRKHLKFRYVTILPDTTAGNLGHLMHHHAKWFRPDIDSSDRTTLRAQTHIIVSLAGQIAEARFRGRRPRYGMDGDNRSACGMAFHLFGSTKTTNAFLHYCWSATEDLISADWRSVRAVAAALLEKQTLKYDEVIEVIMPGAAALRASLARASEVMRSAKVGKPKEGN